MQIDHRLIKDFNNTFVDLVEEGNLNDVKCSIDMWLNARTPQIIEERKDKLSHIKIGEVGPDLARRHYISKDYCKDIDHMRVMDYDIRAVLFENPLIEMLNYFVDNAPGVEEAKIKNYKFEYSSDIIITIPKVKIGTEAYLFNYRLDNYIHYTV